MPRPVQFVLLAGLLAGAGTAASSQEFCVACNGPDATYRCIVSGEPVAATRGTPGKLLCIKELAQSGPHATCSVRRGGEDEPCLGELRTVMLPASPPLAAPLPGEQPATFAGQDGAPAPAPYEPTIDTVPGAPVVEGAEPAPEQSPETLEDLAKASGENLKKAGDAVGDTAKNAGNAVGDAVKKTWNCLSSFFGDC